MKAPRLKDLGRWLSGGTPPREDAVAWTGTVPWLSAKDFGPSGLREPTAFITEAAARAHSTMVPENTVLLIARGMALANGIPVATTRGSAAFNQDLKALVPSRTYDARYIAYAIRGCGSRLEAHVDRAAHGTAKLLPSVFSERLPTPPLTDQERIAAFLDDESARIEAARARLRDLADRGLEPALALAEKAWSEHPLAKVGYRFEVQLGKKLYESRIDHATAKPYLRIANVYWDRFDLRDVKAMNFDGAEGRLYALRPGDLLVCEGRGLGRSAVWDGEIDPCFFQMSLNRVRSRGLDSARWVMWCLRVLNRRDAFIGDGPSIPHVTAEQLRATRIPLPDPATQHRLVAEIDAEAARAKRLTDLSRALDERLDEYRGALITSAVKGEIEPRRMTDTEMDERLAEATEDALR